MRNRKGHPCIFVSANLLFLGLISQQAAAEPFKSVEELGPVVSRSGHLFYAKTSERARFLGSSMYLDVPADRSLDDRTALIMARYGLNLMRFHCHPNYYTYNDQDTALRFNPKWMDDIDRIVAAARKYGIYFSLSVIDALKVNDGDAFPEPFFPGDDLSAWKKNVNDHRCAARGDPRFLAIYKRIIENFLNHVNPYTKLAYKDDPAFLYFQIWNESSFGYDLTVNGFPDSPYNRTCLTWQWENFLKEKYGSVDAALKAWGLAAGCPTTLPFRGWRNPAEMADTILFGEAMDLKFYGEVKKLIDTLCNRDVPVMLTQLQTYPRHLYTQTKTNLGGYHTYYSFNFALARAEGVPLIADEILPFGRGGEGPEDGTLRAFWGKNDNRLTSIPTSAAVCALQDLDGLCFFTSHWGWFADVAQHSSPTTLRNWGGHSFAVFIDSINRTMLKIADPIFRRCDLRPLSRRLIIQQTPERLLSLDRVATTGMSCYPPDWVFFNLENPEQKAFEYCIANSFSDPARPGIVQHGPDWDTGLEPRQFWADFRVTETLPGSYIKGWQFKIDTLRTQGFWGWNRTPKEPMTIDTGDFTFVSPDEVFAVAATSEDNVPLSNARSILLVTAGREHSPNELKNGQWAWPPPTQYWPTIQVHLKRPASSWVLQPLNDAFEPLGAAQSGNSRDVTLNEKVHFYRLAMDGREQGS